MSLFSVCLDCLRCRRSCEKKPNYCKSCSRVCDNDYYDVDKFSDVHLTSFPSNLDISSTDRADFDLFLCKRGSACCSLCHPNSSDKKCTNFEIFNYARDLFAAFCGVLVRMYLNYTMNYLSGFISNISLSDESKIFRKNFKYAYDFLNNYFDVNHRFFMGFFICLLKLTLVIVMLFIIINQNMDHIMDQKLLWKFFSFNFSCLVVIDLILLKKCLLKN